jgi:excisionase family DNA binding protein
VVDPGALLTPDDVAARLRVSRSMAYVLIKRGELEAIHVGRLPRVTEAAFAEYMARLASEARR